MNQQCRVLWIDFAKLIAIIAVMTDHTKSVLYTNNNIRICSFFSVSVFILMMGISSYWSYRRYEISEYKTKLISKILRIIYPYLLATFVYYHNFFDFEEFISHLIHFNACGPLYYVSLYVQLLIVVPFFFVFLQMKKWHNFDLLFELLFFFLVILLSSKFTCSSNILNIYGGGGKFLGGSYLILLYLGMWFAKYYSSFETFFSKHRIILFMVIGLCIVFWLQFIFKNQFNLDRKIPFGGGINPPSISLIVYAILISLNIYAFDKIIHSISKITTVFNAYVFLCRIGQHTLFIFLFHIFYMTRLHNLIGSSLDVVPIVKSIIYISGMIILSLATEFIYTQFGKYKDHTINQFISQLKTNNS